MNEIQRPNSPEWPFNLIIIVLIVFVLGLVIASQYNVKNDQTSPSVNNPPSKDMPREIINVDQKPVNKYDDIVREIGEVKALNIRASAEREQKKTRLSMEHVVAQTPDYVRSVANLCKKDADEYKSVFTSLLKGGKGCLLAFITKPNDSGGNSFTHKGTLSLIPIFPESVVDPSLKSCLKKGGVPIPLGFPDPGFLLSPDDAGYDLNCRVYFTQPGNTTNKYDEMHADFSVPKEAICGVIVSGINQLLEKNLTLDPIWIGLSFK